MHFLPTSQSYYPFRSTCSLSSVCIFSNTSPLFLTVRSPKDPPRQNFGMTASQNLHPYTVGFVSQSPDQFLYLSLAYAVKSQCSISSRLVDRGISIRCPVSNCLGPGVLVDLVHLSLFSSCPLAYRHRRHVINNAVRESTMSPRRPRPLSSDLSHPRHFVRNTE